MSNDRLSYAKYDLASSKTKLERGSLNTASFTGSMTIEPRTIWGSISIVTSLSTCRLVRNATADMPDP